MKNLSAKELRNIRGGNWWSDLVDEAYGLYQGVKRHFL